VDLEDRNGVRVTMGEELVALQGRFAGRLSFHCSLPFSVTLHCTIIEILSCLKIDGRCIPQITSLIKLYETSC